MADFDATRMLMDKKTTVAPPRNTYIGGGNIAAILGLDPWQPAWAVYKKLRGEWNAPDDEQRQMRRGKLFEQPILELFKWDHPGFELQYPAPFLKGDRPHFGGSPDAYLTSTAFDLRVGAEVKSVNERNFRDWGPSGTDQAPPYYVAQCMWYLGLDPTVDEWWLIAQIGADDQRVYPIRRDPDLIEWMQRQAEAFWQQIQAGIEPPLDTSHDRALEAVRAAFGIRDTVAVIADEKLQHWRAVEHEARATARQYEATADAAKAHLLRALGDGFVLSGGGR